MKIMVLGTNTASDYISQKLLEDDRVEKIYHFGAFYEKMPSDRYVPCDLDKNELVKFINNLKNDEIDLIIPTVLYFQLWVAFKEAVKRKKIPILMPFHNLGNLEWSKLQGKRLLSYLGIPTPEYQILNKYQLVNEFYKIPRPFVIKYEQDWKHGLQTIVITDDNVNFEYTKIADATASNYALTDKTKEPVFIIEQFVKGIREYSWHAICNSTGWKYLGTARDYKKRFDNDVGFNTAGMGSYSPVADVDPRINEYADSIVSFLKQKGTPYVGILYLGIMIDETGTPQVLEINTRFGSPEIESIIPTIETNLLDIFYSAAADQNIPDIKFNDRCGVSIRIVNKTYDESVLSKHKNFQRPVLWPTTGDIILSRGSKGKLLNSLVSVEDATIEAASDQLYNFLKNKIMGDFVYRKDIGYLK